MLLDLRSLYEAAAPEIPAPSEAPVRFPRRIRRPARQALRLIAHYRPWAAEASARLAHRIRVTPAAPDIRCRVRARAIGSYRVAARVGIIPRALGGVVRTADLHEHPDVLRADLQIARHTRDALLVLLG